MPEGPGYEAPGQILWQGAEQSLAGLCVSRVPLYFTRTLGGPWTLGAVFPHLHGVAHGSIIHEIPVAIDAHDGEMVLTVLLHLVGVYLGKSAFLPVVRDNEIGCCQQGYDDGDTQQDFRA